MSIEKEEIIISDETIVSFYRENTHIDIIAMNHILIDILKTLSQDLSKTMNNTINSKILSVVSNIDKNVSLMKSDLMVKIYETKKDYVQEIKGIMSSSLSSSNEKMNDSIGKLNELFVSRLTTAINEIIPRSQEKSYSQIEDCIKNVSSLIKQDTSKLLEITDTHSVKTITENMDKQLNQLFSSIQQPIFSSIQSSEERTTTCLNKINETILVNQTIQETLRNEMKDFLNKYKNNSQFKGAVAEIELQHILQSIMPSDEILKVSSDTATCDFKVNRKDPNKPSILFENKYYKNRSAPSEEVRKFERDLQQQNSHGIFISQESPITFKDNYQIDIIHGLIHVYIPNANYSPEKIKIAVDIIDNLSMRLKTLHTVTYHVYSVCQDDINELTEEYKQFGIKKAQMLETIKTSNRQLMERWEELQLPSMRRILIKLGNLENDNEFKCTVCNVWSGKNKASLSAHSRTCKANMKYGEIQTNNEPGSPPETPEQTKPETPFVIPPFNPKKKR